MLLLKPPQHTSRPWVASTFFITPAQRIEQGALDRALLLLDLHADAWFREAERSGRGQVSLGIEGTPLRDLTERDRRLVLVRHDDPVTRLNVKDERRDMNQSAIGSIRAGNLLVLPDLCGQSLAHLTRLALQHDFLLDRRLAKDAERTLERRP